MRVAIDARPAVTWDKTGVGYYTWHLIHLLPQVDPGSTYVAWYLNARRLLAPWRAKRFFPRRPNLVERATPFPARMFERLSQRYEVPRVEWFLRSDVFFAPNFLPPPTRSRRLVLTVHDLAFRRFPETAPHATRSWLSKMERTLPRATRIIAPSNSTKTDLVELFGVDPDRVAVIHHGVDASMFHTASPQEIGAARARFGIDGPYLLFVGGIEPRKNIPGIIEAFAKLPDDVRPWLVVAGSWVAWNPEGIQAVRSALETLPEQVRRRVVFTGYVADADKVALLSGAEALVYPSLYEGFGFPVLEAMACGTPVLASDAGALPEVAGDAALLVPPRDVDAIAQGMEKLLRDEAVRGRVLAAGPAHAATFRWEDTARRTAEVIHQAKEA